MNGGRGEPSKTGGAKRPLTCAAQLNFVSSRHGGIYLSRQKVWSAKRPPTCAAQLNFVSSRHGIYLSRQKVWSAKRPLTCAAQLNFVSSRHVGISLPHGSDNSDRKALFSHPVFFRSSHNKSAPWAVRSTWVSEGRRLFFGSFVFCALILSGSVIYYCL